MAGPWLLAASLALRTAVVTADIAIGAPAANVATQLGHLVERQISSATGDVGTLVTTLIPAATICPNGAANVGPPDEPEFQTTSATVRLPGGDSTVFATRVRRQAGQPDLASNATDAAQLVSGTDGCSTLFVPTTTSICSAVVSPIGLAPVTITDCDQYVTFSSEILFMCAPTPRITPGTYSPQLNRIGNSFTTRPFSQNDTFQNASTTYTSRADSNDSPSVTTPSRSYSSASGMPMSLPRHLEEKRQIMLDPTGKPMETDAVTIAPGKHINPRQLMFNHNGEEAMTDLAIVAPSYTESDREPIPTSMPARQLMMASGMTGTGNLSSANRTAVGVDGPVVTKLMPIPEILKAKYKRKYIAIGHKARQDQESPAPIILNTTVSIENRTVNGTLGSSSAKSKRAELFDAAELANVADSTKPQHENILESNKVKEALDSTSSPNIKNSFLHRMSLRAAIHESRQNSKRLIDLGNNPMAMNSTTMLNSTANSTRIAAKLAKLDIIRLANANRAANLSPPSPTKFYAAPWSEVAAGGIPEHILGVTCYGGGEHIGSCKEPDADGDPEECECVTERQSWRISTVTETRHGYTVLSYAGPLVITGAGGATTSTNIEFVSTIDTTRTFVNDFIAKSTLSGEGTITKTYTSVPSATISLLPIETGIGDMKAAAPQAAPEASYSTVPLSLNLGPQTIVYSTSIVATETVTVDPPEETGDMSMSDGIERRAPPRTSYSPVPLSLNLGPQGSRPVMSTTTMMVASTMPMPTSMSSSSTGSMEMGNATVSLSRRAPPRSIYSPVPLSLDLGPRPSQPITSSTTSTMVTSSMPMSPSSTASMAMGNVTVSTASLASSRTSYVPVPLSLNLGPGRPSIITYATSAATSQTTSMAMPTTSLASQTMSMAPPAEETGGMMMEGEMTPGVEAEGDMTNVKRDEWPSDVWMMKLKHVEGHVQTGDDVMA